MRKVRARTRSPSTRSDSMREVWGEQAAVRDTIYVDLWESYVEPAS